MNRRLVAAISGAVVTPMVITVVLGLTHMPIPIFLEPFMYLVVIVVYPFHLLASEVVILMTPPMYLTSAEIPREIAILSNDFAVDFYKQILDDEEDKNIFFSPAAIYLAFSALYEGAEGSTSSQLQDGFAFESDGYTRYNTTVRTTLSINSDDPYARLSVANALWVADWITLHYSYRDVMRVQYYVDVEKLSFTGDSVKRINDWAAAKTNDKIDGIITKSDVNDTTSAVLTSAVYFKGTWTAEFSKEDTRKSDFWINTGSGKEADFMNANGMFDYVESDGAQVLRLPYKGDRLSMLVILPTERHGLAALEKSVSAQQMDRWMHSMSEQEVNVSVPKFETKTRYNLIAPLMSMGITDIFDNAKADLYIERYRSLGNMYVDIATQDAYVKINEVRHGSSRPPSAIIATQDPYLQVNKEGTEVAAMTNFNADSVSPKPPRFTADHPFLFTIYDEKSGMILFMGRISDPTV